MESHAQAVRKKYVGLGLSLGVAIGPGLGMALGNLALGIGPGIALGVAGGLLVAKRKLARSANKPTGRDDA